MPVTTDDTPGPRIEEEVQFEDRTSDGNPSINGAVRFVSDDLVVKTAAGVKSLTGLDGVSHAALDTLTHEIAESSYDEITYAAGKVSVLTVWDSVSKTKKIREETYTYSGSTISQVVTVQYDGNGLALETMTETYAYSGSRIISVTRTKS